MSETPSSLPEACALNVMILRLLRIIPLNLSRRVLTVGFICLVQILVGMFLEKVFHFQCILDFDMSSKMREMFYDDFR